MRFTDQPATAADLLTKIGVFLGEKVLGPEIMPALHKGIHHRSLLVRQPEALEDRLAAAFARVPWEIAQPAAGEEALFERNLVVRMELPGASPAYAPPLPGLGELLRVLLVFAEAPGSRPLAMRLEREQLLGLFYDEVIPARRVAVDVLCHGVTREALREKVRGASGYHIVHWGVLRAAPARRAAGAPRLRTAPADARGAERGAGGASGGDRSVCRGGAAGGRGGGLGLIAFHGGFEIGS